MSIVDELAILINFQETAASKNVMAASGKAVSSLVDKVKLLGITSLVTSGIMAAWGVNAANSARDISNLAASTLNNTKEVQTLGLMYEQVGGKAEDFASDAVKFMNAYKTPLNLAEMEKISEEFQRMSESAALFQGRALGFSDPMIRLFRMGPEALRQMAAKMEGFTTSDDAIQDLVEFNKEWSKTYAGIKMASSEFQAGISDGMIPALRLMNGVLATNKDSIAELGKSIGGYGKELASIIKSISDGSSAFNAVTERLGGFGLLLDEIAEKTLGVQSKLSKDIMATKLAERQEIHARTGNLEQESRGLSAAEEYEKYFTKIQNAKADAQKTNPGILDMIMNALPIYSQRTISGAWDSLSKDYTAGEESYALIDRLNESLEEARERSLANFSPAEKRWMASSSSDLELRKKLTDLGWSSDGQDDVLTLERLKELTTPLVNPAALTRNENTEINEGARNNTVEQHIKIEMTVNSSDPAPVVDAVKGLVSSMQTQRPTQYAPVIQ